MNLVPSAGAQLLMSPARQLGEGGLRLTVYAANVSNQDLNFRLSGSGTASTSTTGALFPSASNTDAAGLGNGGGLFFKLSAQPYEGFEYSFIAGAGHYGVSIPSVTAVNSLTGDRLGTTIGAGVKWTMVPDTVVTPAAALDVSAYRSVYGLTNLYTRGFGAQTVDERLTLEQLQAALVLSKRFGVFEPYGGVKWLRTFTRLKDLATSEQAGGIQDATIPFVGARLKTFEKESLVVEASLTNGVQIGGGIEIKFK